MKHAVFGYAYIYQSFPANFDHEDVAYLGWISGGKPGGVDPESDLISGAGSDKSLTADTRLLSRKERTPVFVGSKYDI